MAACECGCGQDAGVYAQGAGRTRAGKPRKRLPGHGRRVPNASPQPCLCGCGKLAGVYSKTDPKTNARKGQPKRYLRGHHNRTKQPEWREEDRGFETPCHVWVGHVSSKGYAVFQVEGCVKRGHVKAYEREYGAVPPGYDVHHKCEVKECVRADHLEALPKTEHGRITGSRPKPTLRKLTMSQARSIRRAHAEGIAKMALARTYGVTKSVIDAILEGRTYREEVMPSARRVT